MIINVYKEKGWTSFDVSAKIRGILRRSTGKKNIKVGHAGTLDPLAEGVLLVLTDHDTKLQDNFLKCDKEYDAVIGFGITSPTYDLEGPLKITNTNIDYSKLKNVISKYVGLIDQKVPPYSAVKVNGSSLYKKARKGKISDDSLPVKKVFIESIEIIEQGKYENKFGVNIPTVRIIVKCGKGTYIRSLAHDLGEEMKTGATLLNLIRTRVGDHLVKDSIKISDVEKILKV